MKNCFTIITIVFLFGCSGGQNNDQENTSADFNSISTDNEGAALAQDDSTNNESSEGNESLPVDEAGTDNEEQNTPVAAVPSEGTATVLVPDNMNFKLDNDVHLQVNITEQVHIRLCSQFDQTNNQITIHHDSCFYQRTSTTAFHDAFQLPAHIRQIAVYMVYPNRGFDMDTFVTSLDAVSRREIIIN